MFLDTNGCWAQRGHTVGKKVGYEKRLFPISPFGQRHRNREFFISCQENNNVSTIVTVTSPLPGILKRGTDCG